MTLPTSVPLTAEQAFDQVLTTARGVTTKLAAMQASIAAGNPIDVDTLISLYLVLNGSRSAGVAIQSVPGLPDFAKGAVGDPNYDIVASFQTSIVACKAVTDWLLANLPGDGGTNFYCWQKLADGTMGRVSMPVAQLADLSNLIDAAQKTFA